MKKEMILALQMRFFIKDLIFGGLTCNGRILLYNKSEECVLNMFNFLTAGELIHSVNYPACIHQK